MSLTIHQLKAGFRQFYDHLDKMVVVIDYHIMSSEFPFLCQGLKGHVTIYVPIYTS